MISINQIKAAYTAMQNVAIRTPLLTSDSLNQSLGFRLWVKCEVLQRTGSFKFRGAYNAISSLPDDGAHILAYSSGNHAQAVAHTSKLKGRACTVIMPKDAPLTKRQATASFGANIHLYNRENDNREEIGNTLKTELNAYLIPPFDDARVIAGQGTVGLEIAQQCIENNIIPSQLIVCCGGGGLIAGASMALAHTFPDCSIHSAEPDLFDDMARSITAKKIMVNAPGNYSICDAIVTPSPGKLPFQIAKEFVRGGFSVSDDAVCDAMRVAYRYFKLVVEPGGAVALASALQSDFTPVGDDVIVTLSGGNVDERVFARILQAPSK
ncbi:threonine/serine dehydratase [Alphaproteobacteria bacterium]|nr:threonine/serine dehydratase [Alphaproteobacteria bacterium]MBT5798509.1 threonine/serine dehydratase [Alphaproteobacteria bacterium]MDA9815513.1 threonine/serine dehydratase [Alphaproteobacteria bacterium]